MTPSFLILTGNAETVRPERAERIRRCGLELVFSAPRLRVFANRHCGRLEVGASGVVLGTLFHRHGPARPIEALSGPEAEGIVESGSGRLLGAYWGGYVAALVDGAAVRVLREPSGALPCWFVAEAGGAIFSSGADILVACSMARPDPDWAGLADHFYRAGVPLASTAIRGVEELMPGFSMRIAARPESQTPCWSPWDHVRPTADCRETAAERLRRSVEHCVQAWAWGREKILLSVSGGLDSSIVAAALARTPSSAIGLTMYGEDASGDERPYARALCNRLGLALMERPYRLEDIDINEPLAAHLPRPRDRTQALAYERVHIAAARDIGACAFMTGNGGDSVFGYSQSAAPVADHYMAGGSLPDLLRTLGDVRRQTGAPVAKAAVAAWRIARGPRRYLCRPDPLFLHAEVLAALKDEVLAHPWLEAPPGALPGKAAHIASILRIQQSLEPGRSRVLPVLNPLMSQPVIETCLAVPTWEWRAGGRDRSLARTAFAGRLPKIIIGRRAKGGPDGFAARILDGFRGQIAERLLDGRLVANRVVNRDALEKVLRDEGPCRGEHRIRILQFAAAEAWLDHWCGLAADAEPRSS